MCDPQSLVAERMARLLQDQGIQGVEAVEVVSGAANAEDGLQSLEGLVHFGLLEPHVRPQALPRGHLPATSICRRLQSDINIRCWLRGWYYGIDDAETIPKLGVNLSKAARRLQPLGTVVLVDPVSSMTNIIIIIRRQSKGAAIRRCRRPTAIAQQPPRMLRQSPSLTTPTPEAPTHL